MYMYLYKLDEHRMYTLCDSLNCVSSTMCIAAISSQIMNRQNQNRTRKRIVSHVQTYEADSHIVILVGSMYFVLMWGAFTAGYYILKYPHRCFLAHEIS